MEQIKTFRFSENHMRELYAHMHKVNETSRLLEALIKDQDGRSFTAEEAGDVLSLLGNNTKALTGEVVTINQQVQNWTNSLRQHLPAAPKALSLSEFFNALPDGAKLKAAFYNAQHKALTENGEKRFKTVNGDRIPHMYNVQDLEQFVSEVKK